MQKPFPVSVVYGESRNQSRQDPSTGERTWQYRGNSSEAPIVVAARKVGLPEDIVSQHLGATDSVELCSAAARFFWVLKGVLNNNSI